MLHSPADSIFRNSNKGSVSLAHLEKFDYFLLQFIIVHVFKNLLLKYQVRESNRTPPPQPAKCASAPSPMRHKSCFVLDN